MVLSTAIREVAAKRLGQVERTARAFWQDAWAAMGGDIVRALVEYITNADDAYARRDEKGRVGRIFVEVEHKHGTPWEARVKDRATGMSVDEMEQRIGKQGVRASGFSEGRSVRGNLGLGSKDPACFGKVTFESIKDGIYSWFAIDKDGERTRIPKTEKATKAARDTLGITANGVVVTIRVTEPISCPHHENLKRTLERHVLLRDVVQDPEREVLLLHANKPGAKPERLHFEPPKTGERVNKKHVPLPGYKEAFADIVIAEAEEPFQDEGPKSPTRMAGLLIKGKRAIYESTLFSFEGNQYALAFTGYIRCEDIDRVANEYDERAEKHQDHTRENPRPIISRQRDGLADDHPLYLAIARLAEAELAPLVAEREKRAKERSRKLENEKTTKLLSQLAKEAAKFMQETAEEEEIDLISPLGKEKPPPLAIVPGAIEMPLGAERTVSVMAAKEGLEDGEIEVELTFAPPGVATCNPCVVKLGPSRRREDVLTGTTKLKAGKVVGTTMLNARIGARADDCIVDVVEPTAEPEPVAPNTLEFERERYRLVLNKPKAVKLRAPLEAYPHGTVIRVTSTARAIVPLDGGTVVLHAHPQKLAIEGTIHIEGRLEKAEGTLTATDPNGKTARTEVEVVRREESGTGFETKLVDDYQGDQRAQWSGDYAELLIMGEHPAVKPYLGDKDKVYPGQDSPEFKMLTAELMSDAVVRRILQEKYREDELDAATFYVLHNKLMSRLLVRAHRVVTANL